jgi:hypothetical protein
MPRVQEHDQIELIRATGALLSDTRWNIDVDTVPE